MSPFLGVAGLGGAGSLIGAKTSTNWYLFHGDGDNQFASRSMTLDSQGNVIVCGKITTHKGHVFKYNSQGDFIWGKTLYDVSIYIRGVVTDSSDNIYVCGSVNDTDGGGLASWSRALLIKYNSSGVKQWSRQLSNTTDGSDQTAYTVKVDSSDNIYYVGSTEHPYQPHSGSSTLGRKWALIAKWNSSGTLQWQRWIKQPVSNSGLSNQSQFYMGDLLHNGGTDLWTIGAAPVRDNYNPGDGLYMFRDVAYIGRFDSSNGSVYSTYIYYVNKSVNSGLDFCIDSQSDGSDLYMAYCTDSDGISQASGHGGDDIVVSKFNSSGTEQWSRVLGTSAGHGVREESAGISVDNSGNVYVLGQIKPLNNYYFKLIIFKFNSSGTLQWQRLLEAGSTGALLTDGRTHIKVDNLGHFYIYCRMKPTENDEYKGMIIKLSDDGSGTGAIGDLTYSASSFSDSPRSSFSDIGLNTSASGFTRINASHSVYQNTLRVSNGQEMITTVDVSSTDADVNHSVTYF